jgi:hypothetical protein
MVTNALSPMRVVETMQDLVQPRGTIGIISSGQGSITNNGNGNFEVYQAALNMFMRSFAIRRAAAICDRCCSWSVSSLLDSACPSRRDGV